MDENDFPDPDEEYDLLPTNVYQKLKNCDVGSQNKDSACTSSRVNKLQETSEKRIEADEFPDINEELELLETNNTRISNENDETEKNKKRTFSELFGDVTDLLGEDILNFDEFNECETKRPRWDEPNKIIAAIHLERKKFLEKYEVEKDSNYCQSSQKNGTITARVPTYNFFAVTRRTDCQRLYVKVLPENKFNTSQLKSNSVFSLSDYSRLKEEAEEIIAENVKRSSLPKASFNNTSEKVNDELWVDKYRPKTYMDLLSDETINRDFLRWIKLWDKVVFHRELKPRKRSMPTKSFKRGKFGANLPNSKFNTNKFISKSVDFEAVDNRGFPVYRIVLISGPPGLGKTTLAHIVAKHAGYNVVDINASDDRGTDAFRQVLLASTQMKSMIGGDPRPNCLVLDEIDGAPAASIDLLLKFVQGKLQTKGKKAKDTSGKSSEFCKRPIVCICNEAYTPSLKPLRAAAYMINVSKVNPINLTDRLMNIAHKENIRVSQNTLLELVERSGCDIRVCVSALQYMGKNCRNISSSLGSKNMRKGIFKSWQEILQIPMKRHRPLSIHERVQNILNSAYTDASERLAMGVFENYPQNCHERMNQISTSLEWFQFYDNITTMVMTKNDWRVMPYTNYAFVSWHLGFAGPKNPQLSFPQASLEAHQKLSKNRAIVATAQRSCGRDSLTIALDIAPCLFELINPRLRAVATNLYSTKERTELNRLIDVMLNLGLSFIQEKSEDGTVAYNIDPNLFEIGIFSDCKTRRGLFYTTKQMVSQELEIERLKRAAKATGISVENSDNKGLKTAASEKKHHKQLSDIDEKNLPNHSKNGITNYAKLGDRVVKDFFKNFKLPPKQKEEQTNEAISSNKITNRVQQNYGVWFKYKEGYSNAIRRKVKMSDLL